MATVARTSALRNLSIQNCKLAHQGQHYNSSPDLIHAVERPASMAWRFVWSRVNRRGEA